MVAMVVAAPMSEDDSGAQPFNLGSEKGAGK
jgi:hypothetical protein